MDRYDGILIGAGHNSLVCAAYMAKSGLKVAVYESESEIGGAASTEEFLLPGYKSNMHANFFIGLEDFPIVSDLELSNYGFKSVTPEVQHAAVFRDGTSVVLHRDVEKSVSSISRISKSDAESYRYLFNRYAVELAPLLRSFLFHVPLPPEEIGNRITGEKGKELLSFAKMSIGEAIDTYFEHSKMRTLFKLFAHAITVEDEPGTGMFLPSLFSSQTTLGLPVGGARELPKSLENLIRSHGGEVFRGCKVEEIYRENGHAAGVILSDGSKISANSFVASGLNAPTSIRIAGEDAFPEEVNEKMRNWDWGFHSLMTLHLALSEPPKYLAENYDPDVGKSFNIIFGADTDEEVTNNTDERRSGKFPSMPMGNGSCNSLFDSSYAPEDGHVAFWWPGAPYRIDGDDPSKWDEIKEPMTQQLLDIWREYAPNLQGDVVRAAKLYSPNDLNRRNKNIVEGAVRMGAYTPSQLGVNRPHPLLSGMRTPLEKFYLCSSSCHGGGLNGAPGYNAANAICEDLKIDKWWTPVSAPSLSS
ncbi:MAG: NAD(P)/FAD-dependent oxidoreductase [Nitrospinota bacterium]|nr:NAD(P)/FAD-dependent oxidoreductase [Nitrospinota bacterium]